MLGRIWKLCLPENSCPHCVGKILISKICHKIRVCGLGLTRMDCLCSVAMIISWLGYDDDDNDYRWPNVVLKSRAISLYCCCGCSSSNGSFGCVNSHLVSMNHHCQQLLFLHQNFDAELKRVFAYFKLTHK